MNEGEILTMERKYGKQPIDKISLTEDFKKYLLTILEKEELFKEYIIKEGLTQSKQALITVYEENLDSRITLDFIEQLKELIKTRKTYKIKELEETIRELKEGIEKLKEDIW